MNVNLNIPVSLFDYRESSNTLYSFAKLKIFYIGETADKREFTKEFSDNLLETLPYVPIVGYYDEEEEDFIGHNPSVQHIYGVVPEDTSLEYIVENGKEYAVCDVILYTGRLDQTGEIAQKIVGKPHSLELNPEDTTYDIVMDSEGNLRKITFTAGSLLGLSILGDDEKPAFTGSGFFKASEENFTDELRSSMNQAYQEIAVNFKSRFSRHSYENRMRRLHKTLDKTLPDDYADIVEMTDEFAHYWYMGDYYRIYYIDNGYECTLIGEPEIVHRCFLTDYEIEIIEGYETSDWLDYLDSDEKEKAQKAIQSIKKQFGKKNLENHINDHEDVEVKTVEVKELQEQEIVETNDSTETSEINEETAEVTNAELAEEVVNTELAEEDKDKEDYEEEEKEEEMEEQEDEEEEMEEQEDEEEELEEKEDKDKDKYSNEEGEEFAEETTQETAQIEQQDQEESNSAALNNSEREELEAFRRERKQGLIDSFEDDLSAEFLETLSENIDNYSFEELEIELSKEFTKTVRSTKKEQTQQKAFVNSRQVKTARTPEEKVAEMIRVYKNKRK